MTSVTLTEQTYELLERRARAVAQTPDQVADQLLRQQLTPKHAYIEVVEKAGGPEAVIRGTRVAVRHIVGYIRQGETAESIVADILPSLTLAQVYDALSYYHDHPDEIEQAILENSEEYAKEYWRKQWGEERYRKIFRQTEA